MTLTDQKDANNGEHKEQSVLELGQVLVDVLKQALSQERITFGVFECAEVLEMCPDQVMLCVLPQLTDTDIAMSIQHKLIEAHCWENAVNLVKVDSADKLASLLTSPDATGPGGAPPGAVLRERAGLDLSCLLVGFPLDDMSEEDFHITKLSYLFQETEVEAIALPD